MKGRIYINDKWSISIDETGNYMPTETRYSEKKKENVEKCCGFYSSVESAVKAIVAADVNAVVVESGMTLGEYLKMLREERQELERLIKAAMGQ